MEHPKSQGTDEADSKFMEEALTLAHQAASEDEVPVGAVVVFQGKIVGTGYNRRETLGDPLSHAELQAISAAAKALGSWRLLDCTLYVTLEPCPMCLGGSQQARLKNIVFGVTDPKGGALSLGYRLHEDARTHHRFEVEQIRDSGISRRCGAVLSEFFSRKRSKG